MIRPLATWLMLVSAGFMFNVFNLSTLFSSDMTERRLLKDSRAAIVMMESAHAVPIEQQQDPVRTNMKVPSQQQNDTFQEAVAIEQQQRRQDSFRADNLLVQEKVPCGVFKCFYPSKSDPSIGYLVTPIGRKRRTKQEKKLGFSWFEQSWQYAKHLEKEYNVSHFLLEAPMKVKLSEELATRLNTNIFTKKRPRYKQGAKVGVQKVKTAISTVGLLATQRWKRKAFLRDFDRFLPSLSSSQDKEAFATNFAKDMKQTRVLLEKEQCLMDDFQVWLDTSGYLHHLDFERCFPPLIDEEKKRDCVNSLEKIERHVRKALARV